jgi:hypothetical protein
MEKLGMSVWAGFICFRTGEVAGSCTHSNTSYGFMTVENFFAESATTKYKCIKRSPVCEAR